MADQVAASKVSWDDDASRKILAAIRRAARTNAKLLLIEALLPNDSSPNWPTTLDIVMLTIGGRQREQSTATFAGSNDVPAARPASF